jgi:hypothetical protein
MEGGEVHVGEFLLAERTELAGRDVQSVWGLVCRHRGCHRASRQRKSQSGEAERRYCSFGHSLLVRSLLRSLHGRILHVGRMLEERSSALILRRAIKPGKIHMNTKWYGAPSGCIHLHERHRGKFLSMMPSHGA